MNISAKRFLMVCVSLSFLMNMIGQKYECAKRWNVHCVTTKWFFDSVDKGFCQDESIYKTEPRPEAKIMPDTSTPAGQMNTIDSKCHWIKINHHF